MHPDLGEFIYSMPPQQIMVSRWYRGTADSIYQNLTLLESERPEQVLILSGDHVYKLNYREMLDFHLSQGADLTVAAVPVPREEASSFGILKVDEGRGWRISWKSPPTRRACPTPRLFPGLHGGLHLPAETLVEEVIKDAKNKTSKHDFGGDIIPQMVGRKKVFAYNFPDPATGTPALLAGYRAAGRLFQGPLRTCWAPTPPSSSSIRDWPMRGRPQLLSPQQIHLRRRAVTVEDSLIASGCIIEGHGGPVGALPRGQDRARTPWSRTPSSGTGWRSAPAPPSNGPSSKTASRSPQASPSAPTSKRDAKRFHVTENGIVVVPNNVILEE